VVIVAGGDQVLEHHRELLVAEKDPERRSRFAVRWLRRLLEEDESLTIEEAAMAASCLSSLGGPSHEEAFGMLAAMAERATRNARARRLASRRREPVSTA
jgi:hypothetical protein